MARKTDRRLAPGVFGRPRNEIPANATTHRQGVGAAPDLLAGLDGLAKAARRTPAAEVAVALERYLTRDSVPEPDRIDPGHAKTRFVLPADLLRQLDERHGVDHREEHLVAVLRWWVDVGHKKK